MNINHRVISMASSLFFSIYFWFCFHGNGYYFYLHGKFVITSQNTIINHQGMKLKLNHIMQHKIADEPLY